MEEFRKHLQKITNKQKLEIQHIHDQIKKFDHACDSLKRENENIDEENKQIADAIESIKKENDELLSILKQALEDLKKSEGLRDEQLKNIRKEIISIQKQIQDEENDAIILRARIRLLTVEKNVFKDFEAIDRCHFLQNQIMENDKKRQLLLDAIDAAYEQWLKKLRDLKAQIDKYEPAYVGNDHRTCEAIKKLYDQLYKIEKYLNRLLHEKEQCDLKASTLSQRDMVNRDFKNLEEKYHAKIAAKKKAIQNLKHTLFEISQGLLKSCAQTKESSELLCILVIYLRKVEHEIKDEKESRIHVEICKPKEESVKEESIKEPSEKEEEPLPQSAVKFIRLGEGTYTFGTRKIAVRIINGKLVIRVGGGYMMIQEFLRLYTLQELDKLRQEDAIRSIKKDKFKHGVYAQAIRHDPNYPQLLDIDDMDKEIVFELRKSVPGHKLRSRMTKSSLHKRGNNYEKIHITPFQNREFQY